MKTPDTARYLFEMVQRENRSYALRCWPDDIAKPSLEECELAVDRHEKAMAGRYSDSACNLGFMMATWTRECWWQFFFPEQDSGKLKDFHQLVDRVFKGP